MIYSLVITLCSISSPSNRATYEQSLTASSNPGFAYVEAQAFISQWQQGYAGMALYKERMTKGRMS